jgi:phenylalanyl-tRNA synthetase beta chain
MLVSLKWLSKYVDLKGISPKDLAEKITRAGIEVESVTTLSDAQNCVVGYVTSIEKHPDADKLNVCQVDLGEAELSQIVCGAPNVDQGQKVVVAKVGAKLPGDLKIKKAKLRGVVSNGMICSLKELGVQNKYVPEAYQSGIYVLDEQAPIGKDAIEFLGLDDTILELGLTPNRSDCLSLLGVAYEVAAILNQEVRLPIAFDQAIQVDPDFTVNIESENCDLYYAKKIRNVKIEESPLWLQRALMASNIRPINNVVDITNYVMLELGQPLHAFDYNKLNSQTILVRNADQGEKIITLDDQERELIPTDLVITDGKRPIAIAGVMGGQNTEIDTHTTDVLLESAVFAPLAVRKTYTRLNLRSESSLRYEKQVDHGRTLLALNRASQLMEEICGGKTDGTLSVCDQTVIKENKITITISKINRVLGLSLTTDVVSAIFKRLNFNVKVNDGSFEVTVPSRRQDITIEEDLIEEVIRLYGYENLGKTLPMTQNIGQLTPIQQKNRRIKRLLQGAGLTEVLTYSLTSEKALNRFKWNQNETLNPIVLKMPLSEDKKYLRHSLIHHLLEVIKYNNARQIDNLQIFEISKSYEMVDDSPKESLLLAGALTGIVNESKWQGKVEMVDFFYAKGIVESIFDLLNIDSIQFVQANEALGTDYHQGRTAYLMFNNEIIGLIGQVHPAVLEEYDLKPTFVFEINLDRVYQTNRKAIRYQTISRYPQMTRDIALVVNKEIVADHLIQDIRQKGGELLKTVELFDVYEGEHVEEGHKSLAFSLVFERVDRTLTEEEVTKAYQSIIQSLESNFGASLRQ